MKQRIIVFLSFLLISFSTYGQLGGGGLGVGGSNNPTADRKPKVDWAVDKPTQKLKVGDTITITLNGTIQDDWYIYSNDFDPNLGPNLAEITFKPKGYKLLGKTKAIGAESHYEEIWGGTVRTFKKKAQFIQKIIITSTNISLNVSVLYQACSTVNGMCLPPEEYINETTFTAEANSSVQTPEATPEPAENQKPAVATGNQNVGALEKEKEKYTPRDSQGNDVSRDYLKNFIRKGK